MSRIPKIKVSHKLGELEKNLNQIAIMSSTDWKCYSLFNGFKYTPGCTQEGVDFVANYKAKDDDMFVVTYPKSGTTWTQQIIYLTLDNGVPQKNDKQYSYDTFFEFTGSKTTLKPMIKTHLPYNMIPYNPSAKYLIVFRNPKDVVVSLYYHIKKISDFECDLDFHQFLDKWMNGHIFYGDYFEHNMTYWRHRNDPNVTYLVYEQMKSNPREAVLAIGRFLGQEYVDALLKSNDDNETVLDKVVKYSTIDYMKTDVSEQNQFLLRKGVTGDWRNHFTKEESDQVDQKFLEHFKGTELEKIWTECMKW